jgi:hypothetical protein
VVELGGLFENAAFSAIWLSSSDGQSRKMVRRTAVG